MPKRILILDDDMDSNITVEAVLQDNGFKVDSYEDPILALENFKSYFYDLVILDIKMPQMDGFVVYDEIKKLDNRIKVCFLTASEIYYGLYADSFSSAGVKSFIRKPIENEELIKRVHQIITAN
ncbi:MAG TPA: response regulator [Candidatus Bathyarchaeia archaeon]|nr:response regulator [Candidatus Bathyarchaeia archaeon]